MSKNEAIAILDSEFVTAEKEREQRENRLQQFSDPAVNACYYIGYRMALGTWLTPKSAEDWGREVNSPEAFWMGYADGQGDLQSLLDRNPNR